MNRRILVAVGKQIMTYGESMRAWWAPADTEDTSGGTYEPESSNSIDSFGRGNPYMFSTGCFAECFNGYTGFRYSRDGL
jgi:hypothetical protein